MIYLNKQHYQLNSCDPPTAFIFSNAVFYLSNTQGLIMKLGSQIEKIRIELNIPIYIMCNILNINSELEYHNICNGTTELTTWQKCMFIIETQHPLDLN